MRDRKLKFLVYDLIIIVYRYVSCPVPAAAHFSVYNSKSMRDRKLKFLMYDLIIIVYRYAKTRSF